MCTAYAEQAAIQCVKWALATFNQQGEVLQAQKDLELSPLLRGSKCAKASAMLLHPCCPVQPPTAPRLCYTILFVNIKISSRLCRLPSSVCTWR